VSLVMAELIRVSTSPLPRRRRRGGLAMVVLSAMVSMPVHVRSCPDVQRHGWVLLLAVGSAHGASWVSASVAMVVSLANQLG
jgi:hypothetical protein